MICLLFERHDRKREGEAKEEILELLAYSIKRLQKPRVGQVEARSQQGKNKDLGRIQAAMATAPSTHLIVSAVR